MLTTLEVIAATPGCPMDAVYIGEGASSSAVFYENRQRSNGTRCACLPQQPHWQECQTKAAVTALLSRLNPKPDLEFA